MADVMDGKIGEGIGNMLGSARQLSDKLQGKEFDIISCHSAHGIEPKVLENCKLKTGEIEVLGTLVKIRLDPFRSISFDEIEEPMVHFESERQIRIIRRLSSRDVLTRIILIH